MIKNDKNKIKIVQIGLGHDHAPMALRSILKQEDIFEFCGLYIPENEIDTFIQGLFFLLISLIFGLIGIVKTQKKSLGTVLCLPSICFSILIIIFYVLINLERY